MFTVKACHLHWPAGTLQPHIIQSTLSVINTEVHKKVQCNDDLNKPNPSSVLCTYHFPSGLSANIGPNRSPRRIFLTWYDFLALLCTHLAPIPLKLMSARPLIIFPVRRNSVTSFETYTWVSQVVWVSNFPSCTRWRNPLILRSDGSRPV